MSSKRYPEESKIEAVKQVTERGHPAAEVASRITFRLAVALEPFVKTVLRDAVSQPSPSTEWAETSDLCKLVNEGG